LAIMRPVLRRVMHVLFVLCCGFKVGSAQTVTLGVLEDVRGADAGEPNSHKVRVLFKKNVDHWEAFPSNCPDQGCLKTVSSKYPREVVWTVAFDGRDIGRITGRTPKEFHFYSHVGLQEVISAGPVPTVGKRSAEYGGSTDASVYRPLVAISQPFFEDPDSWKVSQVSSGLITLLRKQFRKQYPKLCRASKQDEDKLEPFSYHDEDVSLAKSYASKKGWRAARLHLAEAIACDDVEAGFEIDDPWFVITPKEAVQYLDAGMWLVDAGDYDNDGKSEVLFSINRYNIGGYELFYDDFKRRATFEFNYH